MVISWVTQNETFQVYAEYGFYDGQLKMKTVKGQSDMYEDEGPEKRRIYIHKVHLFDLLPGQQYGEPFEC